MSASKAWAVGCFRANLMDATAAERPTIAWSERVGHKRRLAPGCDYFHNVSGIRGDANGAGRTGKQNSRVFQDQLVRFCGRKTRLQEIAKLTQHRRFPCQSIHFRIKSFVPADLTPEIDPPPDREKSKTNCESNKRHD